MPYKGICLSGTLCANSTPTAGLVEGEGQNEELGQPAPPPGLPRQAELLSSFYQCEVGHCVAELSHNPACVTPESTLIPASSGLGGFSPQHGGDRPGVLV